MEWARAQSNQHLTETVADARMEEWGIVAAEVGYPALEKAVLDTVRNDSKFFPVISEIRERAGMNKQDRETVEAMAAWEFATKYVSRWWHPDIGKDRNAPVIPPRTEYALRQVGGLYRLRMRSDQETPFMRKDFIEAYRLAPIHEQMRPQLEGVFAPRQLAELARAKALVAPSPKPKPTDAAAGKQELARAIPETPLSDKEYTERQQALRRQAEALQKAGE